MWARGPMNTIKNIENFQILETSLTNYNFADSFLVRNLFFIITQYS